MIRQRRYGLTLLELVVVLAILAVLSLVGAPATESAIDQARYDVTLRTLDNVEFAILGPSAGVPTNESRGFAGFVADVGRPPLTVGADQNSGGQMMELWSNPRGLRQYDPASTIGVGAITDPSIAVYSGWRGPYLRLPPDASGALRLLDGWGNAFKTLATNGTLLGADQFVYAVRSEAGTKTPYDTPMITVRPLLSGTGIISGSLLDSTSSTPPTMNTEVRLFVPDATTASGVREYARMFDSAGNDISTLVMTPLPPTAFQFQFPDAVYYPAEAGVIVSAGPKVLKVSQLTKRLAVIHFWLPAGGYSLTERVDLQ